MHTKTRDLNQVKTTTTKQNRPNIWINDFQTLHHRQRMIVIPERVETWGQSCDCPQLTDWTECPGHSTGKRNPSGAQQSPWVEKMELGSPMNRTVEGRASQRKKIQSSVPLWDCSWVLISTCKWGNYTRPRKHPKGLEGTFPGAHTGQAVIPVSTSLSRNPYNSWGIE